MSKIGEIVDNIYSKISWKVIAYIFIAMFLLKSCQSCNRSNKIERIEKSTTVLVDSLIKSNDSLIVLTNNLNTVIAGKNEVNSVQIENGEFYQYKIKNLNDTINSRNNEIKRLNKSLKHKDGQISNLNIEINKLKKENARLQGVY
jgi:peptidoglycan hydrolase CwlO-like protein